MTNDVSCHLYVESKKATLIESKMMVIKGWGLGR